MSPHPLSIGIIGLGLIGGSLAKALARKPGINKIIAFNRTESSLIQARQDGVIESYTTTINHLFHDCDIIFICTTVDKIYDYAQQLIPIIKEDCILTDVGSTKYSIMKKMSGLNQIHFIGGHPMAGSEQTGYAASKEYLFENAYYILTPPSHASEDFKETKLQKLQEIIEALGAIPMIMDASHHDYTVGSISHVPHIMASCLVNLVQKLDDEEKSMHLLAAGGFKDITRIASSSPDMWNTICQDNKEVVIKILNLYKQELTDFEESLMKEDHVRTCFENAKHYRDSFSNKKVGAYNNSYELKVDVEDKPGIIATVATLLSVNNINIKNIGIINSREYENGVLQILLDEEEAMLKSIEILQSMNFIVYPKNQ